MLSKGSRVRNTRWNYEGTVESHLGGTTYLIHADKPGGIYTPVEAQEEDLTPLVAEESPETRAVMRYLSTAVRMHHTIADKLRLDSMEQFRADATRALGDATDVTGAELKAADWQTVYNEIKEDRGE
ncbi:hypothetical protein DT019_08520 [Streptomyces sp. SDr-06]|uniref:hypothetical protein n=1 Tax=Streptomyces sp. SDr-06 TaxID=2267702 RepID=UPI000DEBD46E|nr:hypothetical protein [Streptomyces sp. SDr-06]RCH68709.1 hypothetical protein DT019_08520 [Streptomyces sp. SDr-06]